MVELAVLCQEDVDYDMAVGEDDPEVVFQSLGAERFETELFVDFLYDIVCDGGHVGGGITVADDEIIGDGRADGTEVEGHYVLPFLVKDGIGYDAEVVSDHMVLFIN